MGAERYYSKGIRIDRELAHELLSCSQLLNGRMRGLDKQEAQTQVINGAIERLLTSDPSVTAWREICGYNRVGGMKVPMNIKGDNLFSIE